MHPLIKNNETAIRQLCQQNHVLALYFFGSVVEEARFGANSDVDILVDFQDGISLEEYTDSYFRLLFALEELLGRDIDITTARSVKNPYFKEELDRTKVLFYDSFTTVDG